MKDELGDRWVRPTSSASAPRAFWAISSGSRPPPRASRHRADIRPGGGTRWPERAPRWSIWEQKHERPRHLRDDGLRPRARRRGRGAGLARPHGRRFGHFIGGPSRSPARRSRPEPGDGRGAGGGDASDRGGCRRGRARGAQGATRLGARRAGLRGRGCSMRWRGSCRSMRGCSRCSRRWTTASRSARRATSTCPLVQRHFYFPRGAGAADGERAAGTGAAGVCGQIIPWNFPLLMLAWKVAPALAGEHGGAEARRVHLADGAAVRRHLPRGRGAEGGGEHRHRRRGGGRDDRGSIPVDKIAFTGSTAVGRRIRAATAGTGKALTLELGGKSPYIVFDDADIDSAIEGLVDAIWFNQGQVCCAGSRLLVQEGVAERFHAKLKRADGRAAHRRPAGQVHRRRRGGGPGAAARSPRWWTGGPGRGVPGADPMPEGLLLSADADHRARGRDRLMQEEIFGPVLVSTTFRTPEEAVRSPTTRATGWRRASGPRT
jgi:aldehyde dehydrogenase (NAD+)